MGHTHHIKQYECYHCFAVRDRKGEDYGWVVIVTRPLLSLLSLLSFAGDYISYLTQGESQFFCETLEECTVYVANFEALDRLYASELKWMTLARKISDMQLITIVQRMQMLKPLDATAKYKLLKEIAPVYEEVLSNAQFASVLGIAPQSLSRVKGKL